MFSRIFVLNTTKPSYTFITRSFLFNVNKRKFVSSTEQAEEIPKKNYTILSHIALTKQLNSLIKSKNLSEAFKVFYSSKRKLKPNAFHYNILFKACFSNKRLESINKLMEEMKKHKVYPNVETYTILLNGFIECGQLEKAEEIFEEMKQLKKPIIDSFHVNKLISYYLNEKQFEKVDALKKEMNKLFDSSTLNVFINFFKQDLERTFKAIEIFLEKDVVIDDFGIKRILFTMVDHNLVSKFGEFLTLLEKSYRKCPTEWNAKSFSPIINYYTKLNKLNKVNEILEKLEEIGVNIEKEVHFADKNLKNARLELQKKLIKLYESGEYKKVYEYFKMKERVGIKPDVMNYNVTLQSLVRLDSYPLINNLYLEMYQNGIEPSEVTFSILMSYEIKKGNMDKAMKLFQEMQDKQIPANEIHYMKLINGFASLNKFDEALKLIYEMKMRGLNVDSKTFHGFFKHLLSDPSKLNTAFQMIDLIQNELQLQPDVVLLSTIFNVCLLCNELDRAFDVLISMKKYDIQSNVELWNKLIHSYTKNGNIQRASELLLEMEFYNVKPDKFSFTTILSAYVNKNEIQKALNLLEEMKRFGIEEDFVIKNILMVGLLQKRDLQKIEEIFNSIKVHSHESINNLMRAYIIIEKDYQKARSIFDQSERIYGVKPNHIMYTTLIDAYCKFGLMDAALYLKEKMKENNIEIDCVTYSTLIKGFLKQNQLEWAYNILNEMKEIMRPNGEIYTMFLQYFLNMEIWDDAMKMIEEIDNYEIVLDEMGCKVLNSILEKIKK